MAIRKITSSGEQSQKLMRLALVLQRARKTFGNLDAAQDWLNSPNAALGGATPCSLLDTEVGTESVIDSLGRIEHGVFA